MGTGSHTYRGQDIPQSVICKLETQKNQWYICLCLIGSVSLKNRDSYRWDTEKEIINMIIKYGSKIFMRNTLN